MKQRIILYLKGGLGNQMFQYATARYLCQRNDASLYFDLSYLNKDKLRSLEITKFKIKGRTIPNYLAKFLQLLKKNEASLDFLLTYKEQSRVFEKEIFQLKNPVLLLDGYWQSPIYFKNIKKILIKEFTPDIVDSKNISMIDKLNRTESVAIHVRRTDYLTNKAKQFHGLCSIDYYVEALRLIKKRINDPIFFFFSDDIDWVKQNIKIPNSIYVDFNKEAYLDLYLMSNCAHFITANSTFSWWGAWLSTYKNKTVISPEPWYSNGSQEGDIVPSNWVRLKR